MQNVMRSATIKLFLLAVLSLLLLIPLLMISGVVRERMALKGSTEAEIAARHGGEQLLLGPFLVLPRQCKVALKSRFVLQPCDEFILPETQEFSGQVATSVKKLGLYEAPVYEAALTVNGTFDLARTASLLPAGVENSARLAFALSDPRGIRALRSVQFGGRDLALSPSALLLDGMAVLEAKIPPDVALNEPQKYTLALTVAGSRQLNLAPLGRITTAALSSTWADPGFSGAFLPLEKTISAKGFRARWQVLELNRRIAQRALAVFPSNEARASAFGVEFIVLASSYQQSERALKYGFLFIVLTFAGYFLFEVLAKIRLHPVQYGLIGAALAVFYLLLLAAAEVLGFALAYLLAAGALALLVGAYSAAILQSARRGLGAGAMLAAIYALLYVLVASEQHALLLGAMVLLAVIAATMYLTRRVDWYGAGEP